MTGRPKFWWRQPQNTLSAHLVRWLSWMAVLIACVLMLTPWILERLRQAQVQSQLVQASSSYAHDLENRLSDLAQMVQRDASGLDHRVDRAMALSSTWMQRFAELRAIRAEGPSGRLLWVNSRDEQASEVELSVTPTQMLARHRALEHQTTTLSSSYVRDGKNWTDMQVPVSSRDSGVGLLVLTLDTSRWIQDFQKTPWGEEVELSIVAFIQQPSQAQEVLINDPAWEGAWTLRFRPKDSTPWVLDHLQPLMLVLALLFCLMAYFILNTFKRQIQAEQTLAEQADRMQKQEQLSVLGELSASIAHEINQPLASIANFSASARLMLESGRSMQDIAPVLERISEQSQRASRVIHVVRALLQNNTISHEKIELSALIQDLTPHFESLMRPLGIELDLDLQAPLWVQADPTLLQQVLLNLVKNSTQSLQHQTEKAKKISIQVRQQAGLIRIVVEDNGPGIPTALESRIFESFFTTRKDGLGIGLNFCRSVMERLNGRIELAHNSNLGAGFALTLPVCEDIPVSPLPTAARGHTPKGEGEPA